MDETFGYWFAGFTDGEGCFAIRSPGHARKSRKRQLQCCFTITLRADDLPVLRYIQEMTGVGKIYAQNPPSRRVNSHPAYQWVAVSRADCAYVVDLFTRYPLRAKKAKDFEVWKQAVLFWLRQPQATKRTGQRDPTPMIDFRTRLQAVRKYEAPASFSEPLPKHLDGTLFPELA